MRCFKFSLPLKCSKGFFDHDIKELKLDRLDKNNLVKLFCFPSSIRHIKLNTFRNCNNALLFAVYVGYA